MTFGGEKNDWTWNVCSDFLINFCLKCFLCEEDLSEIWSKMYIGLQVKYLSFLSDFNESWISSTGFGKTFKIGFYENPCNGSPAVPCGRADGQRDMKKPTVLSAIFRTRLKTMKSFLYSFFLENSNSKEYSARYDHKCTYVSCKVPVTLVRF